MKKDTRVYHVVRKEEGIVVYDDGAALLVTTPSPPYTVWWAKSLVRESGYKVFDL